MTLADKSNLLRHLGVIEGIGYSLEEKYQDAFFESFTMIIEIIQKECEG